MIFLPNLGVIFTVPISGNISFVRYGKMGCASYAMWPQIIDYEQQVSKYDSKCTVSK